VAQDVVIIFTYNAVVCSQLDIEQALQTITESVVDDSINCAGFSDDCISYNSQVEISAFIYPCLEDQPPGTKCALITDQITLIPNDLELPITTEDKDVVRVKVVDALNSATGEGGVIYNRLACPLNPTDSPTDIPPSAPTSTPNRLPSLLPSSIPSYDPVLKPNNTPSLTPTYYRSNTPSLRHSGIPSWSPSLVPTLTPSESLRPTVVQTESPSISVYPSIAPSVAQDVVIIFTYNAVVCSQLDIEQALQTITESVVDDSINCAGFSDDCISYNSQVEISAFIYPCLEDQPPGTKCALITDQITLIPNDLELPITTEDKDVVRVKVVDALNSATGEGGVIYNRLYCTLLSPSQSPSVSQVILIDFTSELVVSGQVDIEQILQSLTETIIEEALSCDGISANCIPYVSSVMISSYVYNCFDEQPPGKKCVLLTFKINLNPSALKPPITVEDKVIATVIVVDSLQAAIKEGGLIYTKLNPVLSSDLALERPSFSPTVWSKRAPAYSPSLSVLLVPPAAPVFPSVIPAIVQDIIVDFIYDITVASQLDIDQVLHTLTETLITDALSCNGNPSACISFDLFEARDFFFFSCIDGEPHGSKCALISESIILTPMTGSLITLTEHEMARARVVDALNDAVQVGGAIYNALNP